MSTILVPPGSTHGNSSNMKFTTATIFINEVAGQDDRHGYRSMLRLETDAGGVAFADLPGGISADEATRHAVEFKAQSARGLIGVDPFDREYVWQRLQHHREALEIIDRMLWVFMARQVRRPVYKLLGGYRDKTPVYRSIRGDNIDDLIRDALAAKAQGYKGVKDQSRGDVDARIDLARELRSALGDEMKLMHDAAHAYSYVQAVSVGRVLEKYNYRWIEEPLPAGDVLGLKKLSATLDLPVLALTSNTAAAIAMNVCDIVRQGGVGFTGQIKEAQIADAFGFDCHGSDPHTTLAIKNDPMWQAVDPWLASPPPADDEIDCLGKLLIEDGHMCIRYNDKPARKPDWNDIEKSAVAVI